MGVSTSRNDEYSVGAEPFHDEQIVGVGRFRTLRAYWPVAIYDAQWSTFMEAWASLGDVFDKKLAADERSRSFDSNETRSRGGNFDGAGTGGQD